MITKELVEFVKAQVALGKTRGEIHQVLIAQGGWTPVDIDEALGVPTVPQSPQATASSLDQRPGHNNRAYLWIGLLVSFLLAGFSQFMLAYGLFLLIPALIYVFASSLPAAALFPS